jgi:hypothetical protein
MIKSPYNRLPPERFWKKAVEESSIFDIKIYNKKFNLIASDKIATSGSCFAQHISRRLKKFGYHTIDLEKPPIGLPSALHSKYGYGLYSARFGNIYTPRQLLQLAEEAVSENPTLIAWEKDGRFYDALRPLVEPYGLPSSEHVLWHRKYHLKQVLKMLMSMDVFIFTLGLTETWIDTGSGKCLPM